MFKGTRKAIERAPRWISGQHVTDPEIKIWTKDFHAAKVALNSIDREVKEQELHEAEFLRLSLDLYKDFIIVRNCDHTEAVSSVPLSMAAFAPIQRAVDEIKLASHAHSVKMHRDLDEIRSLLHDVENLVHKTDRKKIDCETITHKQNIDYDDPASQNIPEIQKYLQFHYHILSLVPQVLKQLDIALTGLVQRQLGYQMYVAKTSQAAMASVLADLQLPTHIDSVDILKHWSAEIEPVIQQLSHTRTLGSVAVLPPPPTTWQKVKHTPDTVTHGVPSATQTKQFASNVGNTFHHGISYIYPVEAKFFNPRKGIFGEKEEYELKLASEGKEVEHKNPAAQDDATKPVEETTPQPEPQPHNAATNEAQAGSPVVPAPKEEPDSIQHDSQPKPIEVNTGTSAVPPSPTAVLTSEPNKDSQPFIDSTREVMPHTGIAGPAHASETPSLTSVDEHPHEGTSIPASAQPPLPLRENHNSDDDELL